MNFLILLSAVYCVNSLEVGEHVGHIGNKFKINKKLLQFSKNKRSLDPKFYGYPKTREYILARKFNLLNLDKFEQIDSLVQLLVVIAKKYFQKCPTFIYYDDFVEKAEGLFLQKLFKVSYNSKEYSITRNGHYQTGISDIVLPC